MEEMPKLTKCTLLTAFKCVESVRMRNAGRLEEMKVLVNAKKEDEEEEEEEEWELPEPPESSESSVSFEMIESIEDQPMISTKNNWDRMDRTVEVMNVSDNSWNGKNLTELDLSGFVNLRELKVGNECFMYVNEVKIIGLSELESVEIGKNSFTQHKNNVENDPNRQFYLKNCPKLKSLKMGRYSFSDYTACEIENVDALEVIEMGDLNEYSANFYWASLELKSILIHSE